MAISKIRAEFPCEVQKVWNLVTNLKNYSWRSDLSKIEVVNDNKFIEYTTNGYPTEFTVLKKDTCRLWEFDMENENMKGRWTGLFSYENGITVIDFTEDVTAKKFFMKPFVKAYLKKQQKNYISDLTKALKL